VPSFSVVVPVFNSASTVSETIASVLAQTRADLELTLVDDGSELGTADLLDSWRTRDERVHVIHQPNGGTAAARNTGIEASAAPLISFLDDDDMWLPTYLESVDLALTNCQTAGFAHVDAYILDETLHRIRRATSFEHYEAIPDYLAAGPLLERLVRVNYIMSSVTCRASVLHEVGGFDPELRGTDDWDMWLRIAAAGYGATHPPSPELVQRDRSDSQSKDEAMMLENSIAVLDKLAGQSGVGARERTVARRQAGIQRRRLSQVRGRSPIHLVRRMRRRIVAARNRNAPTDTWLDEPPEHVANALPAVLTDYGKSPSKAS